MFFSSVGAALWALIGFSPHTHIVETLVYTAPPTPIKGLWLNFHRWKTLLFGCARS